MSLMLMFDNNVTWYLQLAKIRIPPPLHPILSLLMTHKWGQYYQPKLTTNFHLSMYPRILYPFWHYKKNEFSIINIKNISHWRHISKLINLKIIIPTGTNKAWYVTITGIFRQQGRGHSDVYYTSPKVLR